MTDKKIEVNIPLTKKAWKLLIDTLKNEVNAAIDLDLGEDYTDELEEILICLRTNYEKKVTP